MNSRNFNFLKILYFWLILITVIFVFYAVIFNSIQKNLSLQDMDIFYYVIIAILIGMSILPRIIKEPSKTFMQFSAWVLIFLIFITAYAYHDDIMSSRVALELFPQYGIKTQNGAVQYKMTNDGHFKIRTKINGQVILFLLDTGASDVTLTKADAKRIGINLNKLNYSKVYNTANGKVRGAPVNLNKIELSKDFYVENVEASVNSGEINISLLGMSFLEKIHGYKVEKGILTLIR